MSTRFRGHFRTVGATVAAAALLAACSSSSGSDSNADGKGSAGSPIVIGSSGSLHNPAFNEPQLKAGLDAAVAGINATGGIKGRQLKLDFCDSAYDPNKELSCARQLINDHVVATVHPSIFADSSGAEFKLYNKAKIAVFGGYGVSPLELTDSNSYPLSSGLVGWVYGAAKALKDAGAKKVSVVIDNNPPSQYFGTLAQGAFTALGYGSVNKVTGDETADPTMATAAAKATGNGADGILIGTGPVAFPRVVKAIRANGYTGKIAAISATMEQPILKALGADSDGFLVSSQLAFVTDTANPGIQKFLADMKQFQPKGSIDDLSLAAWASVELFAKILGASSAATMDSAAFNAALANLTTPVDIGVIAPYTVDGVKSPLSDFPRVLNATVQVGSVHSGKLVPDGKGFSDPFTG